MDIIKGYHIIERVAQGKSSIVYRGKREIDNEPVILKVFRQVYPSIADIARFKKEYELIKSIDIQGVVKTYGLVEDKDRIALILEDFDGVSLKEIIKERRIGLAEFLEMAVRLSDTLGYLHKKKIIHKDIKPQNLLYNAASGVIKITDFGISSILSHGLENLYDPTVVRGTLTYMSPEQTGRINRAVDYRTDLYSLGVTFYELLTGDVPFASKDPLELIYYHIAKEAVSPDAIIAEIPEMVARIIMKLLSKNAESRYKNSYGLKADLEECLNQFRQHGEIRGFQMGLKDISERYIVPQGLLVGREDEKKVLMDSLNRVCHGSSEVVLISGPPGIGKSALVHEINDFVIGKRGYFIASQYDRFRKHVPYSSIIHAFQKLMRQILTEGKERIDQWKEKIVGALGENCQLIVDVIPELELVTGPQPAVQDVDPDKSQHRFNKIFSDFIHVFARKEHPLVIFLDDLHIADTASLNLIKNVMQDYSTGYFLLIGAFRDDEMEPAHPMIKIMDEISDKVIHLSLGSLDLPQIGDFLALYMNFDRDRVSPLADVLFKKTDGNPFFLNQFLVRLFDSRAIEFTAAEGWIWDIDVIESLQVSDNVVDALTDRITLMSHNTQSILKLASCIGKRFDLDILSTISRRDMNAVLGDLQEAIDLGLIYLSNQHYEFLHEKIQEAAYSLFHNGERKEIHYRIGKEILANVQKKELMEKIFYIVNHFNEGIPLIEDAEERIELARLNLTAGRKAKMSTAYASAVEYLSIGIKLLNENSWASNYQLTFDLYIDCAESLYLTGNFDEAVSLYDLILKKSPERIDKARVYDKKIILYTNLGDHEKALDLGIRALKLFGIGIPRSPGRLSLAKEFIKTRIYLGRHDIRDLLDAPVNSDPEMLMVMTLLVNAGTAAYFINENVVAYMAMKMVLLSLKNGNMRISSFGYLSYGLILGYGMGNYERAYDFGRLALDLNDRFNNIDIKPKLLFIFGMLISHWRRHGNATVEFLRRSYTSAVETGDINYAVFSAINFIQFRLRLGHNLEQVMEDLQGFRDFVFRTKNDEFICEFIMLERYLMSHQLKTDGMSDYSGEGFDEGEFLRQVSGYRVSLHSYYLFKIESLYYEGNYRKALEIAEVTARDIYGALFSQANTAIFCFHYSLIMTGLYHDASKAEQRDFRKKIRENQKRLKKWALNGPDNYYHKYLLVEAEVAAIKGDLLKALELYDKAKDSAHQGRYTNYEALASELAGRHFLRQDKELLCRAYIFEAQYGYLRYGSVAKVKNLMDRYPQYNQDHTLRSNIFDSLLDSTSTSTSSTRVFDVNTLLKTSQIISGEIVLEKLLKKLVLVIAESASASRGAFIIQKNGEYVIEASGDIENNEITVLQSLPIDDCDILSPAIVHYVARTRENLVLNDASNKGLFMKDPYVMKNKCKSIICMPLVHQGKLSGIFYAENNLTTDAFTEDRLELLHMLTSYVAISFENAQLYASLEEKVKERTTALEYAYEEINNAYNIIKEDVSLARRIQENILPRNLEKSRHFDFHICFYPMSDVGGDIYDIVEIEPGFVRIFLADATGHGIQAALVTMLIKSEYEKMKYERCSPSELMGRLNNEFFGSYRSLSVLFSCIIADIDLTSGTLRYTSAGHPDQYILHGDDIIVIKRTGRIVGFVRDLEYRCEERSFSTEDRLLLFSDGIFEEFDIDMKEYGERRLMEVIRGSLDENISAIIKNIIRDVQNFIGKSKINSNDDVTIIGVEPRKGPAGH